MTKWEAKDMRSQHGKIVIVTGANSGIGYPTALELARHGAVVILACRSAERGHAAEHAMRLELALEPAAGQVVYQALDLSSLASVRAFTTAFLQQYDRLDLLIHNAGIMGEHYATSEDGYELQFATNYLGPFALTAQLFSALQRSPAARIVVVNSLIHRSAKMRIDQALRQSPDQYNERVVYSHTKLFSMLFMRELNRRLQQAKLQNIVVMAAHPGFAATNIAGDRANKRWLRVLGSILIAARIVQRPAMGALPTLYAATVESVLADEYVGPRGLFRIAGHPALNTKGGNCDDAEHARLLWTESERLAGIAFAV
jgi:NAD(P)-dependent dehydrogenase (short-subunit alcohol dehydrogenase family)